MMRNRKLYSAGVAVLLALSSTWSPVRADDAELAEGIRQAQQGEFEAAVITLEHAARRLAGANAAAEEMARAYVYLGVAQLGLAQDAKASASFVEARRRHPGLQLASTEFPPKIVQAFEQAVRQAAATPTPMAATQPAPVTAPPERKGGSKAIWILGGVGVAGGAAALAAGGGGTSTEPPVATATPAAATPPDIAGVWRGEGANGETLTFGGGCLLQNSVVMTISQSADRRTINGPADFVILQAPCNPDLVGGRIQFLFSGTVDPSGQVTIRFGNPAQPNEVWTATVSGTPANRMAGPINGIPGLVSGSWVVVR